MIINGQRVEGRTLSFDADGVKVGQGEDVKVVVPNSFDFAKESKVEDSDFEDYEDIKPQIQYVKPGVKIAVNKKNCMIVAGVAVGIVAGLIIGGVIYKKKRG